MLKRMGLFLFICVSGIAYGQNLARVCVVDMTRIYQESSGESREAREFERRLTNFQNELTRRETQINELKVQHATAIANENQNEANRLQTRINQQTEALREYFQAQTALLEQQRRNLMQSNSFLNQVHDEIRLVAEGEGFSIVLDRSNRNSGVIWNSSTVDITDKVIQNLRNRASR